MLGGYQVPTRCGHEEFHNGRSSYRVSLLWSLPALPIGRISRSFFDVLLRSNNLILQSFSRLVSLPPFWPFWKASCELGDTLGPWRKKNSLHRRSSRPKHTVPIECLLLHHHHHPPPSKTEKGTPKSGPHPTLPPLQHQTGLLGLGRLGPQLPRGAAQGAHGRHASEAQHRLGEPGLRRR